MTISSKTDRPTPHSVAYLTYVVVMLTLVNLVNYADRSIIGVLIEPIKRDLHLSDTQIGILSGFAFALFYATAGLFMARLADLHNRKLIVSLAIAAWTVMASATGLVTSFAQFFLMRMGVGVGEAGAIPTMNAMLADYFPPARRALAIGVVTAGAFFGILAGSTVGGLIGQHYGWRLAFFVVALPGLPLAILVYFTIKDPARGASDGVAPGERLSMAQSLLLLGRNRSYVLFVASGVMLTFLMFGLAGWFPAFLMREHGLSQSAAGLFFGLSLGLGSAAGMIGGGIVSSILAKRSLRWLTLMPVILSFALLPMFELAIYAPDATASLVFLAIGAALAGASYGPVLAATQTVIDNNMRALGAGVSGMMVSLFGLGLAPLVVGALSDSFQTAMGAGPGLQRALAIAALISVAAVMCLIASDRVFTKDHLPSLTNADIPPPRH